MAFTNTVSWHAQTQPREASLNAGAQSRSFTNLGNATASDSKSSAGSTLDAGFGNGSNAWGSGNIWGSGSLTNGFASRATTREHSRSRDLTLPLPGSQAEEIEGKTGSGSLVDTSVLDDMSYRSSYAAKRNAPSGRSLSQARYPESTSAQQRSVSNAGIPQSFSGNPALASFSSRPPTISLNSAGSGQPRHSFGNALAAGLPHRGSDEPPNVYTKFDRPLDPMHKKPDSAIGSWNDAISFPSPTEERRPQYPIQHQTVSVPSSREASMPPSSHSDERPSFSRPEYGRTTQMTTPTSSRAPSISSQRNGAFNTTGNGHADALNAQLGNMRLGGDSRPTTSYRPSPSANVFSTRAPASNGVTSYTRNGYSSVPRGVENAEDVGEIDRYAMGMSHLGLDGYMPSQQNALFPDYNSSAYDNRFLQTPTGVDGRNGHLYANGNAGFRTSEMPASLRSPPDWHKQADGAMSLNRRSPPLPDAQVYLDPRMQQLIAAQLSNSYASAMYSAYNMRGGMQLGGSTPYLPIMPMGMPGIGQNTSTRDATAGDGVQSALMYEFKSNTKTKRYELKDIYDHIAEFSGDQHGSRFIQTKLETANSDEKDRVFSEIQPNAIPLMTDVFGNYVIQKFFEHGDQTHKKILANKMRGRVLDLSLQMYGCRVVQKALDHVLVDQQEMLISELKHHVLKCVKDQNGNHVIQKAIERCPAPTITFIIDSFRGQVQHLSIHPYGCRVIQRCLERCDTPSKAMIMAELMDGVQSMISDQYGNYVVQHIVSKDEGQGRQRVLEIVARGLEGYSKHKFASNVVEKCLEQADDHWRRRVVISLADSNNRRVEGESVLVGMIKDNFGNYVIQKLLDTLNTEDYLAFLDLLHPAMTQAKRTGCGKQLLAIEKRMHRFPPFRNGPSYNPAYQLPLPTPPFASHCGSNANTPPPLTADTQSLQSSGIPSINGDAVEGAAMGGRKDSEASDHSGIHR